MAIDQTDSEVRLAHLEQMIEKYRAAQQRRLLQQAMKLWRQTEAHHTRAALETKPERVH